MIRSIRADLSVELAAAMRRRDTAVVTAMRNALSAIANAEAAPPDEPAGPAPVSQHVAGATHGLGATEAARVELSPEQVLALLAHERADLLAHADRLTRLCRLDEADAARRAADVLAAATTRARRSAAGAAAADASAAGA